MYNDSSGLASIRCDLHMHSRHSPDCMVSPSAIVRAALRKGLHAIAVTDHGTIRGGLATRDLAPASLVVIVGVEVYTTVGDIVCLFVEREIKSRDALTVIQETHDQGGIAFLPHPLRSHPPAIPEDVLRACDGYEVLNARAGFFEPTTAAGKTRWEPLLGKARLGNSDAHFASEIGHAFTTLPGPATADNVRRRILDGITEPGGTVGPPSNFYRSQLVKLVKTGDVGMVVRLARRVGRRLLGRKR